MATNISNFDEVIDSRDIIERIEELRDALSDLDEDEREELTSLESMAEECAGYVSDWEYGETLIRYDYFVEYAQQLAEDCGMLENCGTWPANCIDWDQAARELMQDYLEVDYSGTTYYIRNS